MPTATLRRSRRNAASRSSTSSNTNDRTSTGNAAAPWNSDDEERQLRRGRWTALAAAMAVACAGVGCVLALYFPLHAVEAGRFRDEWKSACEQNVRLLDVAFKRQLAGMVLSAAAYASSVPVINQENLAMYANHSSMDQKVTYSVSNSPILSYDQLNEFESYYGRPIWPKPLPLEDDVLVNGQPIAAPMLYLFPRSLTSTVGGFNQLSDPRRRSALVALLQSPSQRITISDGPVAIIPTNERGFQVWVKAMNRTASESTPFTSWLSGATVEIKTLLGATLANRTTDRGVFVEVIHPTGDLIYSTVPNNDTTSPALYLSQLLTIPVLNQQWTCKCWAATRLRGRYVTPRPSVVATVTAIVFLVAAEVARRGVLRHYSSKRLLQQYQVQNRLLSTLSRYSKAIIEALPDCLLVVNAHGRILGINRAVLDVTGYSTAELESTPVSEIVFPMNLDLGFRPLSSVSDDMTQDAPVVRAASPRSVRSTTVRPALPRIGNGTESLLENGVFEGTVRRSDGSTFLASIAINGTATGTDVRRAMLNHATAAGVTPLVSHQRRLLDDDIAQFVLFHDISDQIQAQRMAGTARFDEREETQTKNSLLRFLAQAILPLTLGMHDALTSIQACMRVTAFGLVEFSPVAPVQDRQVSATSVNVPPVIHARISSRTAVEDIDAAVATAQHMVVLMEDLALLIGTPFCAARQEEESVEGVPLYELQADALRAQDERIADKRLRVTVTVDPPATVVGGQLATLRILMAKMFYLGSSIALPDAAWEITYTATQANRAAATSPSPTISAVSSSSSRSSVSITAPKRRPRACRLRNAPTVPPVPNHPESAAPIVPLSIHLRQTLSAMDKSVILDDLELSLQHGSRGSEFGSLALTFVGLATFVKRIGGVLVRSVDPATGACTLDVEVPLAQLDVRVTFPSAGGAGAADHVAHGLE
ncbi:PAS domain S-box protein [Allomyces macrogynus ATCC 38327]|uniref:PAS domain S-box protein n=1 Tax=Allomyces macrogynus (strain ATCC 38327) TaxID=578462 RepID=A0A0L0RV30_ALLM3|nr:PAS domain S-box protein [Allomyces macrogynus ATCC 38327]|eukprot:KNE54302.1 PAS domain S-box protein [Allomyces macrogynus ATCC 38327]